MLFLLPFLLSSLLAAPPQKVSIRGVVKTPGGALCQGAEVLLVWQRGFPSKRKQTLRTKTDRRGRFLFLVEREGWSELWAKGVDAKGKPFCSEFKMKPRPGKTLELLGQRRQKFETLRLKGLQAWGKPSDLRMVWALDGSGVYTQEAPIPESGIVNIPDHFPLVMGMQMFWVKKKGGRLLFPGMIFWRNGKDGVFHPIMGARVGESPSELVYQCQEPKVLQVEVRSEETKKPLAGAELSFFAFGRMRAVGNTDPQGKMEFKVEDPRKGRGGLFEMVHLHGFADALAYLHPNFTCMGRESQPFNRGQEEKPLVFYLKKDRPLSGTVLGLGGDVVGGSLVRFYGTFTLGPHPRNGRMRQVPSPYSAKVDSSGRFLLRNVPTNLNVWNARLDLSPEGWKKLFENSGKTVAPPPGPLMEIQGTGNRRIETQLLFDLRGLRFLPIQVFAVDGSPYAFPPILWRSAKDPSQSRIFFGDRMGRLTLPLTEAEGVLSVCQGNQGYLLKKIQRPKKGEALLLPSMELYLQPFKKFLRGVVIDQDGKAVKGANLRFQPYFVGEDDANLKALDQINRQEIRVRTDERGRFRLPYLPRGNLPPSILIVTLGTLRKVQNLHEGENDLKIVIPSK